MKDIPVFNTDNGIASLRLKEIPVFKTAYITIQSALDEKKLLEDCVSLCRAAGADKIYANGFKEIMPFNPINIIKMTHNTCLQPDTNVMLFPVQESTLPQWREIYNKKMRDVTGASYMDAAMAQRLLADRNGYFVHRNGELIGIGTACGGEISVVASVKKGAGKDVMKALISTLSEDRVVIEVASDNLKAVDLYSSMGFIAVGTVNSWHKII